MDDNKKTKAQLIDELTKTRSSLSRLQKKDKNIKKIIEKFKDDSIIRRLLVEHSRDGIVVLDQNGKVYEANKKYSSMTGYSMEELYELYVWDWDTQWDRDELLSMVRTVDEKGDHFETRHKKKDGSYYDVEISTNGVTYGGQKLIFCVCRDITQRKKTEEQLRESEEKLSTFINNLPGIAYQIRIENINTFKPILFKGAIERITGYSPEELSAEKNWNNIIYPEDLPKLNEIRKKFQDFADYFSESEYRIIHKKGGIVWVKDTAQIVKSGNINIIHGTIFDITTRKNAEQEKERLEDRLRYSQKLEAIGTLAGGVAHDFNNILGIIIGYTDLVMEDIPSWHQAFAKLDEIKTAGNRAKDIIKQLMTFSRDVEIRKRPLNIVPVIEDALKFLRSTLPSTIEIKQVIKIINETILADPTQIHQVMINLCVNAAQAMEGMGGILTVTIDKFIHHESDELDLPDLPSGEYMMLSVSDTGTGINQNIIDRIFDPYFTTKEIGKGSGMGLAVVHGIIQNHNGVIKVFSEFGKGAEFAIYLPLSKEKDAFVTDAIDLIPTGSETILFVDDEENLLKIAKLILSRLGYTVITAKNPVHALDLFKNAPDDFDLVITDMTMPQMTGESLYHELIKVRSDIPVILTTGYNSLIDDQKANTIGFAAYIMKPIKKYEIACLIRNVLDKQNIGL